MFDKLSFRRILKSTCFGVLCGGIIIAATVPISLLPGLAIGVLLPAFVFFKELLFEWFDARSQKKKIANVNKPNEAIKKKRMLSTELLTSDELSEFKHATSHHSSRVVTNIHSKLDEYQEFFEKKDPLTGVPMKALKNPMTIEGVTKNHSWYLSTEKEVLKKILKHNKTHPIHQFLYEKNNVVVSCYDGYPKRFYITSMFARACSPQKLQKKINSDESLPPKNKRYEKDDLDYALSVGI